jgi:hypothetical protein
MIERFKVHGHVVERFKANEPDDPELQPPLFMLSRGLWPMIYIARSTAVAMQ